MFHVKQNYNVSRETIFYEVSFMYYDYDKISSYNATFNMIITNRGFGKTYGAKKRAINKFLKKGEQFIYVRRYKSELKKVKDKFFEKVKKEFEGHEFEIKGFTAYIDKKVAGYLIPLSTSLSEKSNEYPNVTTILFDEFLIDKSYIRYLDNEVETLLDLVYTVQRERENVRVYLLGNNVTTVNPYFEYFNINPNPNERFSLYQNGELVVSYETSNEFINKMKNTKFGKLVSGTNYEEFAIENKSQRDNKSFVCKLPISKCHPLFSLTLDNKTVFVYWMADLFYFSNHGTIMTNYVLDGNSHSENMILLTSKEPMLKGLVKAFSQGKCRFQTQSIKETSLQMFKKIGFNY